MSFQEKSSWIVTIGLVAALIFYGVEALGAGLAGVSLKTVLTAVIGFIVVVIIGHIIVSAMSPKNADQTDERDQMVDRRTDRVSEVTLSAVIIGVLAYGLIGEDYVLASIAFFGLFGAALVKNVTMIVLYRLGA